MESRDMFTTSEAFSFVRDRLGVHSAKERLVSDRRRLLDDITIGFQTSLPFTNINLMKVLLKQRHRPTMEDIKSDVTSGVGGLCYSLNIAAFHILKALGFDVTVAFADVTYPKNHVVVYVRNVETLGDTFLVEVGVGFATFRAVSLDFETESPVFRDSFLEYKYLRREGRLLRMHREGDTRGHSTIPQHLSVYIDGWRQFYSADMTGTTNIEQFYPYFDKVFTDPELTSFHKVIRLIQFPKKRAVIISNDTLKLENNNGELESTSIEGGLEGIVLAVKRYFKAIPEDAARQAVANWRKYRAEVDTYK